MPGGNREIWILQYYLNTINEKLGGNGLEQLMLGLYSDDLLSGEDIDSFLSTKPTALQMLWLIKTLLKRNNPDEDFNNFMWCLEKIGCDHEDQNPGEPNCFLELWDFLKTEQQSLEEYRSNTEDDTQERRRTCASKEEYRAAKGPEYYYRTAQGHARGQRYRETSDSKDGYPRYTRNFCELRKQIETLFNRFELAQPVNDDYSYAEDEIEPPIPVLRRPQRRDLHTTSEHNSCRNSTLTDDSQNSDTSSDDDRQSAISHITSFSSGSDSLSGVYTPCTIDQSSRSVESSSRSSESEIIGSNGESDKNSLSSVSTTYPISRTSHSQVDYSEKDPSDTAYYNDATYETQYPVPSTSPQLVPTEVEMELYEELPVCVEDTYILYEPVPDKPTTLRQDVSTQNPSADNNNLNDAEIYTIFDDTHSEVQDPPVLKPLLNTEQIYDGISPAALRHSRERKATSTGGHVPVESPGNQIVAVRSQKHQIRGEPTSVASSTLVTDLTDEEWMFTQLDRINTKKILAGTSPGTFLVTSTETDSTLVLYVVDESK